MTGVAEKTIVIFINDNGGARQNSADNGALRGTKGTPFEGGVRVPFAMRWPARLDGGAVYEHPVSALDVVPTVRAAAGLAGAPPRPLDGVDLVPYLDGTTDGRPHDRLHWRQGNQIAIREGDWKLVRTRAGEIFLFDLAQDPGETTDLMKVEPAKARRLLAAHDAWARTLTAPLWPARPTR